MSSEPAASYLLGPEECHAFLGAFEDGSLPATEWTHQAHIAMATVYLVRYGDFVLPHTRAAIRNYLLARGKAVTNYHETLTIFWLAVVAEATQALRQIPQYDALVQNCAAFGSKSKLHESYYGFDVFNSKHARTRWIAPDLKPLSIPFPTDL